LFPVAGSGSPRFQCNNWHQADEERIHLCARIAAVHEDIATMPMGYQTLVGDMGSSLSGGQKQRVLLARALYKKTKVLELAVAGDRVPMRQSMEQ
jgi:ATP-binding cassette subfamily B protein RaxB